MNGLISWRVSILTIPTLERITADLAPLLDYCPEIVLFGSYVEGGFRDESDIDVALITRVSDKSINRQLLKSILGKVHPTYELHIFELLPLKIQRSVFSKYIVIAGDHLAISEYFYGYRKIWEDCKHRILENQFSSAREKQKLMENSRV
jgi:uncharacterized protein